MNLMPQIADQEREYAVTKQANDPMRKRDSGDVVMADSIVLATPPDRGANRLVHLPNHAASAQSA